MNQNISFFAIVALFFSDSNLFALPKNPVPAMSELITVLDPALVGENDPFEVGMADAVQDQNAEVVQDPNAIFIAIDTRNLSLARQEIDSQRAAVAVDAQGRTALYYAVHRGDSRIVRMLAEVVDVNVRCVEGETALACAARKGFIEIVRILLRNGADVSVLNVNNESPLMLASRSGRFHVVMLFLSRFPLGINNRNNSGNTALHIACSEGRSRAIKVLLEAGACLTAANNDGQTPIDLAHTCLDDDRKRATLRVIKEFTGCKKYFKNISWTSYHGPFFAAALAVLCEFSMR